MNLNQFHEALYSLLPEMPARTDGSFPSPVYDTAYSRSAASDTRSWLQWELGLVNPPVGGLFRIPLPHPAW